MVMFYPPQNNPHESYPRQTGQHNTVKEGLRHAIHARRALSHNPVIHPEDLAPKEVFFQVRMAVAGRK